MKHIICIFWLWIAASTYLCLHTIDICFTGIMWCIITTYDPMTIVNIWRQYSCRSHNQTDLMLSSYQLKPNNLPLSVFYPWWMGWCSFRLTMFFMLNEYMESFEQRQVKYNYMTLFKRYCSTLSWYFHGGSSNVYNQISWPIHHHHYTGGCTYPVHKRNSRIFIFSGKQHIHNSQYLHSLLPNWCQ